MISKLIGLTIIAMTLSVVYLFETSSSVETTFRIFHWPAIILTAIGPFGFVMICTDHWIIKNTIELLREYSPSRQQAKNLEEASFFRNISQEYYKNGLRIFDEINKDSFSPTTKRVLDRLALRIPVSDVINLCERERDIWDSKLSQSIGLVSLGVKLCPSVGMLGTILGMTQLLAHMKEPMLIGSNMSLALLTTFYGLFFSLVFWTPVQNQLLRIRDTRNQSFDQIIHWLELLEQRKPAQYFEDHPGLGQKSVERKEKVIEA